MAKGFTFEVTGNADLGNKINKQLRYAAFLAIKNTAPKIADAGNAKIASVFDRPRPQTTRAVKVFSSSSRDAMKDGIIEAVVGIDNGIRRTAQQAVKSGKGIPPVKYLAAEILGGQRVQKRFERALQAAQLMPGGMVAVYAKRSGYLDAYGNLPPSKIVQILSWFKAFPAVDGYRINMTDRTKQNLMLGKRKAMKWGIAYFRGGGKTGLPDGIWERNYPNGMSGKSFIKPILIYRSATNYRVKLPFFEIAEQVFNANIQGEFDKAFANAMRTAR